MEYNPSYFSDFFGDFQKFLGIFPPGIVALILGLFVFLFVLMFWRLIH